LKQSIINLLDAYSNHFKNPTKVGFPNFKTKYDNTQSVRFPIEAISKRNDYSTNKVTLTKELKNIDFKTSDKYKDYLVKHKEQIKSATLSKNCSGQYFLSILVDGDIISDNYKEPTNLLVGSDVGIKDFVICSDGKKYENIKSTRNNEKKLKKLQRNLSRKEKGSKNKEKARIKLAKFNQKIKNKKENYLHEVANELLNNNHVVAIEDLNVSGMMKNHCLAKSIQELSLSRFRNILEYKASWRGNIVLKVDRFFPSSKLCSCCQYKNTELKLSDRTWTCPACNTEHDRDENAGTNIENEGYNIIMNSEELSNLIESYLSYNEEIKVNKSFLDKLNQRKMVNPILPLRKCNACGDDSIESSLKQEVDLCRFL
jgi:putative transposase